MDRRAFLRLAAVSAGAAAVGGLAACGGLPGGMGAAGGAGTTEGGGAVGDGWDRGRLAARPASASPDEGVGAGLRPLGLGSGRDGLVYVPSGYRASEGAPLALTLHGAGGDARSGISHLLDLADEEGVVLLSPASRGRTWDVLVGGYGPDVEFVDRALKRTFDRLSVDPERLAITGFSGGASYALSLGLTNGDLFTHVVAFSPGFASPAARRGKPPVFVSHGTRDRVLPIWSTSRRIVPRLRDDGYEVLYEEFDGAHAVPEAVAREALEWFVFV